MKAAAIMKIIAILLVVYGAMAVAARYLAAKALYYPDLASRNAAEGSRIVGDADGNDIAVVHFPNPNAAFTVWFFHGNAEALGDLGPTLRSLRDAGFAVIAFDYPGYGVSGGRPTEASLYASARAARKYLRDELKVPAARTLIYGRSLGSGPAIEMATEEKVGGLILQSAFTSVFCVVTRWQVFPFDMFENHRKIAAVSCPVLVMHGTADEVIPFRHGAALFTAAREPKRSFWVEGARHNDFLTVAAEKHWETLQEFSALCASSSVRAP